MLKHDRVARAFVDVGHAAAVDGGELLLREGLGRNRHQHPSLGAAPSSDLPSV